MFDVIVNLDGLEYRIATLVQQASDLDEPLRIWGGYKLKEVRAIYKAQDFPGLAASTIEKRVQKGVRSLERKLGGDVRRALQRARKARGEKGFLQRLIEGEAGKALEDIKSVSARGVQNRLAVLAEFQRRHRAGGSRAAFGDLAARAQLKPLSIKQLASLGAREDRAVSRAVGKPILGGLPSTLKSVVEGGSIRIVSESREHWTDAHNSGDTVGHGAKLPKRETLSLTQHDLDVFIEILKDHLLYPAFDQAVA